MLRDRVQSYCWPGTEMLEHSSLGRDVWGGCALPLVGVSTGSLRAHCKTNIECCFLVLPFFFFFLIKAKILSGFLLVAQTRYKCSSFVNAKWCNMSFEKWGLLHRLHGEVFSSPLLLSGNSSVPSCGNGGKFSSLRSITGLWSRSAVSPTAQKHQEVIGDPRMTKLVLSRPKTAFGPPEGQLD